MTRQFIMHPVGKVAWIINCVVTTACLIVYCLTDGKEAILAYYIPLDFALNVSKAAFFFWQLYTDTRNKAERKELE